MNRDDVILETSGLTKQFGGVRAISGVNFRLNAGELRCLIGPNGAGKSTFFKMLTAQHNPSAGKIMFDGVDVTRLQSHEIGRLGVGIKNQVPDVFDGASVRENIWLATRFRHDGTTADRIVDEVLERLRLTGFPDRLVGELAHGQRQWVEFGMVMALEPKLILLDEPTAGMTAEETDRTAELILEVNQSAAIVVVEHDMQFIRKIARLVTVFHQGEILVEDTMENIQANETVREIYLGKSGSA